MEYEIWSEGYRCTGESSRANFHGVYSGETFVDACENWANESAERLKYFRVGLDGPLLWGCRLFNNEVDARRSFG